MILLNKANNVIDFKVISSGGVSGTFVDMKILAGLAVKCLASSVIVSHNHPSGKLVPSQSDIALTKKIKEGLMLLDIALLDHIILSETDHYSFADDRKM